MKQLIKKFVGFIQNLEKKDKVAVLYHNDSDGLCSALIVSQAIEKIKGKKIDLFITTAVDDVFSKKIIKKLQKRKIEKLIILDLSVDQDPKKIKSFEKFAKILILDHHIFYNDLNSKKTIMIKSSKITNVSPDQYCVSKLSYDLFSRMADIKKLNWITVIGIFGDCAEKTWENFVDETAKKYNTEKMMFKKAQMLIEYTKSAKNNKGIETAFRIFKNAKGLETIFGSKLGMYKKNIEKEVEKHVKNFPKSAKKLKNGFIYEITPKYNLKSILVNKLSFEFCPNKTLVILQKAGKKVFISARRQDKKVSMNDFLEKTLKNIPDSASGGHVPAAGGHLPAKYIEKFKKNLENALK